MKILLTLVMAMALVACHESNYGGGYGYNPRPHRTYSTPKYEHAIGGQRGTLVARCTREYGQGNPKAPQVCSCMVDRYMADYHGGGTRPSADWVARNRAACGA